jgi:ABC-2 type transport system ATP-binding protein
MDEPTTGLDPQSRIDMRKLTKDLNKQGITIIYTTHDMDEAEKICDRISIMDSGKIIAEGTSEELKHMISESHKIEIEIDSPSKEIISELKKLPYITSVELSGALIIVTVKEKDDVFHKLSEFLHKKHQKLLEIRFKEPSLEEVFIQLTKEELRDNQ